MKKFLGIEKFIENGSAIGLDYTNRTCRTSPAPATESPAEPSPNDPAAVTLRRTSPHLAAPRRNPRGKVRHTSPARWGEVYIYFPAAARCPPGARRTVRRSALRQPSTARSNGAGRQGGGRREDGSRPRETTDGRRTDRQTHKRENGRSLHNP